MGDVLCTGCDYRDVEMQKLKQELAAVKEQRWIPVSERLPEMRVEVIVYCADSEYAGLAWRFTGECGWKIPEPQVIVPDNITHWMPLPAPPTTQEETPQGDVE